MEEWLQAWLAGQPMPPNNLPRELLLVAQGIAEHWLVYGTYRCVLEEWISSTVADTVTGGLLWSGFCLSGQESRVRPVPVMVRLLYIEPYPATAGEVRDRMRDYFAQAVREWIAAHLQYGSSLRVCS
jgi:hypothetical protein